MSKDLVKVMENMKKFKESRGSVILATIDTNGKPLASYSPYVELDGFIYLYLSHLVKHKENILNNSATSVYFIEDEKDAKMIAIRERVTYEGQGREVTDMELKKKIKSLFIKKHGEIYENLPNTHGFSLIEIKLGLGRYVFGFGNAYEIDGCKIKHLTN